MALSVASPAVSITEAKALLRRLRVFAVKRRWIGLIVAWLVACTGWLVVASLPDQYSSTARIYVDTQTMLQPVLQGIAFDPNVSAKICVMKQTLLSRPNLEKLTQMTDLDVTAPSQRALDSLIDRLAAKTTIDSGRGTDLFSISFAATNPKLAHDVVEFLIRIFVESNLGDTRTDMESAQSFLDGQIKRYQGLMDELDGKIAEYRRQHMAFLSDNMSYGEHLQMAQTQLRTEQNNLADAIQRRDALDEQLKDIPQTVPQTSGGGPGSDLELRILDVQKQLDDLLIHYTYKHPDVMAATRRLGELQQQLKAQQAAAAKAEAAGQNGPGTDVGSGPQVPNPFYQQVGLMLVQVQSDIAALQGKVKRSQDALDNYQSLAGQVPAIELELQRLTDNRAKIKSLYDTLLLRQQTAQMTEQRDTKSDHINFRIVDPPQVPTKPSGPDRGLFLTGVLAAAIATGVAVTFLLAYLDTSFVDLRQLRQRFEFPVLGAVSMVSGDAEHARFKASLMIFGALIAALILIYLVLALIERQMGLPNFALVRDLDPFVYLLGGTSP